MLIRSFQSGDWEYYRDASKIFYSGGAVLFSISETNLKNTFDACLAGSPLTAGYIIEVDGKPAGFALISFTWSNESGGRVLLLEELYIDEAFRGHKLGTHFLEWMFEEFKEDKRIYLEVTRSNQGAIKLYERMGFEKLEYVRMIRDKQD